MHIAESGHTRIRLAIMSDCAMIKECAEQAYAVYVDRIGKKPAPMTADFASSIKKREVVVLEHDNAILGYAVYYSVSDSLFLENIALRPLGQGQGFGSRLLAHIHQAAVTFGYTAVDLYTNELMTENLRWYAAHGYREIERRYEDGFNRVYLRKNIG